MRRFFRPAFAGCTALLLAGMLVSSSVAQSSGALTAHQFISKMQWRCIGPYVGGRAVTVAGVPSQRQVFYVGTVGGGVWKSTDDGLVHVTSDGGNRWQAVTPPGIGDFETSSIEPSYFHKDTAYLTAWRYMWDDFQPYIYKTTDLGRHWTKITTGLPNDEFAFVIRQDPNDPQLLFLGTYSTVYVSFDGGQIWQPLKLNLPTAEVRDIQVDTRQGEVVAATHGRAFWVLDNLKLLEQLTQAPDVDANGSYVFAPERAWLAHEYGVVSKADGAPGNSGKNAAFGTPVFFHIPANYDGKTLVQLEFRDEQGNIVRSFPLHLATASQEAEKNGQGKPNPDVEQLWLSSLRKIKESQAVQTAIQPGMNVFR